MTDKKSIQITENLDRTNKLLEDSELDNEIKSEGFYNSEIEHSFEEEIESPGSLKFRMDSMKMGFFMLLKAPVNSSFEISIENIKDEILQWGSYLDSVVDWDIIRNTYDRIMFDGEIIPEVKIASGRPVEFKIPGHIILKESLFATFKPTFTNSGQVNYHCVQSFIIIQKGEFLGEMIPEVKGNPGLNLEKIEIPCPKKTINILKIGENIYIDNNHLYSEIDGTYKIIKGNIITIDPLLTVETDVDYHTGDIEYKGDINITKTVREGFSVISGGDIIVKGCIEPADISCGHNLTVEEGIIGSKNHLIECKGIVTTAHIEHAYIKSFGSINILRGVLSSFIYSSDRILLDKKATIVGGEICSQNGIIAGNIGNEHEVETKIILGIDFQIKEKLAKVQVATKEINKEIEKIQKLLNKDYSRIEKNKIKYAYLSLKNKLNSLNNFSRSLLVRLDKNDTSLLIVHGTIFPGTTIEICHMRYQVEQKLSRVKFSLDKEYGRIRYENV
ncbi:MAG: FapA family protein [Spirochaetaceae bacterium]